MTLAARVCGRGRDGVSAAAVTAGGTKCWTAADAAELDVLVHALVVGFFEHRQRCQVCARQGEPGSLPCPHVQTAIAEVLDWREARLLHSRAEALRAEEARRVAA